MGRLTTSTKKSAPVRSTELSIKKSPTVNTDGNGQNKINHQTILVVEDNLINQKVAKLLLESLGYSCFTAVTAKQALKLLTKSINLILLDIGLPDMSGLELCRIIRSKKNVAHIPIIAYTSHANEMREECIKAGMNDFLTKPTPLENLSACLKKYLI